MQPSVTQQFTQGLLQGAQRSGIQLPQALLSRIPPDGRTPLALQDEVWEAYCRAADDPLVGVKLGLSLHVGHLDLVGMLLMSCETLGEAVEMLVEYHPIVGEGGDFSEQERDGQRLLIYEPRYERCRRERVEAVLACVLNLARWVTGDAFKVETLCFSTAPGAHPGNYVELLDTQVAFDTDCDALCYAGTMSEIPLIQANATMRDQLRRMADETLSGLDSAGLGVQIQQLLREQPHWSKERIAEQLGLSGRHLVRKLQQEGTNFRILRSSVLQQLAEDSLSEGASVGVISERLGFSDESAFVKAFKRWCGVTPAQFRQRSRPVGSGRR